MILKKYKNKLLAIIQDTGLDPNLFTAADTVKSNMDYFTITLTDTPHFFSIRSESTFNAFYFSRSLFAPGFPKTDDSYVSNPENLEVHFKGWLDGVVKPYIDEINMPDLWRILDY